MKKFAFIAMACSAPLSSFAKDPPTTDGRVIANVGTGFEANAPDKLTKALFRCMVPTTSDKQTVTIYLPAPGNAGLASVLKSSMNWSEATFERQSIANQQRAGRICFVRKPTEREVLLAVASDPGGVGILSTTYPLSEDVVVIWGPQRDPTPPGDTTIPASSPEALDEPAAQAPVTELPAADASAPPEMAPLSTGSDPETSATTAAAEVAQ